MKKAYAILMGALLGVGLLSFSVVGQTAISVLNIEPGVRALGMGGAAVALAESAETLYYNSAGLAELPGISFNSYYASHLGLASYSAFGLASRNWGLGLLMFNSGGITGYDDTGNPTETLSYGSSAVLLGFGVDPKQFPFIPVLPIDFRAGGCLKYLSVTNGPTNGSGFGLDLAYRMGFPDTSVGPVALSEISLGLTATDVLGTLNYADHSESLGMDLRFGVAARVVEVVLLAADIELAGNFHVGAEYRPIESLAVRAGVLTEAGATSFTIGLGYAVDGFIIDYAFISHPTLPGSHRLSLTIDFAGVDLRGLAGRLRSLLPF